MEQNKTPNSFKSFFTQKGILISSEILDIIATALNINNGIRAILFRGPPGTGKTTIAELIAEYLDAQKVFYQCSINTSEDELLYKLVPDENTKSGIKKLLGPLPIAAKLSKKVKVVLIIDEFDKTRPSVDAIFLDFLQNGRLSLYISDREKIITANKDNLIVILTSNDIREFSEPLLRRIISISLPPLSHKDVYKILKNKFDDEKLVSFLTQLYIDTVEANLEKPATIQELLQLGEAISKNPSINIQFAIKSFVVKTDQDYNKYLYYIQSREPYKWKENNSENNVEIGEYYKGEVKTDDNQVKEQNIEKKEEDTASNILQSIKVSKPVESIVPEIVQHEKIVTFKTEFNEDHYDYLVKTFDVAPAETPDIIAPFKVIADKIEGTKITSEKLFTLSELRTFDRFKEYEAYGEITVKLIGGDIHKIIKDVTKSYEIRDEDITGYSREYTYKIIYWSLRKVIVKTDYKTKSHGEVEVLIKFEKIGDDKLNISFYAKNAKTDSIVEYIKRIIVQYYSNNLNIDIVKIGNIDEWYKDDNQFANKINELIMTFKKIKEQTKEIFPIIVNDEAMDKKIMGEIFNIEAVRFEHSSRKEIQTYNRKLSIYYPSLESNSIEIDDLDKIILALTNLKTRLGDKK